MGRAVFLNVSAPGHVIPTFPLLRELVRRGEEVVYYETPAFQREIESFGASFRAYPEVNGQLAPQYINEFSVIPVLMWYAGEVLPKVLESVRADRPDYIIHDSLCVWGRLIARVTAKPAINSIATAAFCQRVFDEAPEFSSILSAVLAEGAPIPALFDKYEREVRSVCGNEAIPILEVFMNSEPANICYLPRCLQPYAEKFDRSYHFVGSGEPTRQWEPEFSMADLDGRDLIYISFGTVHDPGPEFFRLAMRALGQMDAQVLALVSPAAYQSLAADAPANFLMRPAGSVPQLKILERANVFITHGAGGGAREGAWFGVPMLAVPQTFEQTLLSRRIVECGAGL